MGQADQGNRIESDYYLDAEVMDNHWSYFTSAPVPCGTKVTVWAMESLGGIGIQTKRITV